MMTRGTVKWFNDRKGFGFLVAADTHEQVFVHHTAIQIEGYRTLMEGDEVEFEVERTERGLQAKNVIKV